MESSGTRVARRPRAVWWVPPLVLVVGLLITAAFASQASSSDRAQERAEFDRQADRVEASIIESVERLQRDFEVGLLWLRSQRGIDPDEFAAFFGELSERDTDGAIGTTVAEYVAAPDVEAFETRHRQAGRPGFEVFNPLIGGTGERLIITHTDYELQIFGRPIQGLDVTLFKDQMVGPAMAAEGASLYLAPPDSFLSSFSSLNLPEGTLGESSDALLYLTGNFHTLDASARGIAVRLESLRELLDESAATVGEELILEATVTGADAPAVMIDHRTVDDRQLSRTLEIRQIGWGDAIELGDVEFRIASSSAFEAATGSVTRVWLLGAGLATLAAGVLAWRLIEARRRDDARVELELVRHMAATDPLTGLLNRQGLAELADSLDQRRRPGVLFFLDLDNFKEINDVEGHASGDRVLRSVADVLRSVFRRDDMVCRLGGDEFLIYLPGTLEPARVRDLRTKIETGIADLDPRLGCSVGHATRDFEAKEPLSEMIQRADQAMYRRKRKRHGSHR